MKKMIIILIIAALASTGGYFGYKGIRYSQAKREVKAAIVKDDMVKAEAKMKEAIRYNILSEKEDNLNLVAIRNYRNGKEKYDQQKYYEAKEVLSGTDEKKISFKNLASNIEALKLKVDNAIFEAEKADGRIEEISQLFEAGDYNTADSKIKSIELLKLTEEQKGRVEELRVKTEHEIERVEKEEEARIEAEKQTAEAKKLAENKLKEEEIEKKRAEEEREEKYGKSKYSREDAKKIFLDKSKFDENKYKVEIIDSEDYKFNGDLCYFIRVTDTKSSKGDKKEYYINSFTGEFTLAKNIKQ